MEAYKVSTTLDLNDLVGARIANLIKEFDRLENKTVSVRRRLREFGAETAGIRQASSAVRSLHREMERAEANALRLNAGMKGFNAATLVSSVKSMHSEFQRAHASAMALSGEIHAVGMETPELRAANSVIGRMALNLSTAARHASALTAQLHGVAAAAASIPAMPGWPRRPAGGSGGAGGGGRGSHVGMHGGNMHIGPHGVGVGALGYGLGEAAVPLIGGYLAFQGVKSAAHEAGEYQREQAQFSMFGMSAEQNAQAKKFAESMKVPGTSMIDAMRYMTEAQGVFRESGLPGDKALDASKLVAPILAKLKFASAITGREFSPAQELDFTRSVEMLGGLSSPKRMQELADMAFKLLITSGGNVDPSQLRQAIRTGGTAVKGLSGEALFGYAEPLMGEMKGGPFGTAMSTAYGRANGLVKLPNQALQEMMRLGLWDKDAIVLNKLGGLKEVKQGKNPLRFADEYAANPFKYYEEHIRPAYDRSGLNDQQRYRENALIFGRTGSAMFNLVDQQIKTMEHSVQAMRQAPSLEKAVAVQGDTYGGKTKEFEAAWSNFKVVFGDSVLPGVIGVLKTATSLLEAATKIGSADGILGKVKAAWQVWSDASESYAVRHHIEPLPGQAAPAMNPVAPAQSHTIQVQSQVRLNERILADVVTRHQAKQLSPGLGSGYHDIGLSLPAVGTK